MARGQNDARPPDVRPLDVDGVRTVAIVTVGWGVAFVVLALRQGQLDDAGNGWWLWASLAGVGLGLLGLEYCRKRRDAIAQAALDAEADAGEVDDDSLVGDWSRLPPEEEFDGAADEQPRPDEQPVPAAGDHVTQPYRPAEHQPMYPTGDIPVAPGHHAGAGQAPTAYPQGRHPQPERHAQQSAPAQPGPPEHAPAPRLHEPAQQRPTEWPRPQAAPPPAPTPHQPSTPTGAEPALPAASRSASPPQPAQQQPQPQRPHRPAEQLERAPRQAPPAAPQPPASPPQQPPAHQPEPAPPDPYSTGAGWYDSAAGYTPEADRARTHPRDRRETPEASGPASGSPSSGWERKSHPRLEDSEFFGTDSSSPPPNSTAEFLLADLQGDDDDEQPPVARHDRDAPGDEYRGRRARGSR